MLKQKRLSKTSSITASGNTEYYVPPNPEDVVPGQRYYDKERPTWHSQWNFRLHMVGFTCGLSNFQRFPYLCFKHGGINFIVPYLVCLAVVVFPILYLEMLAGQFAQSGMIRTWTRLVPLFQWVGWSQCLLPVFLAMYEVVIITWALHYCVMSIISTEQLPWVGCNNDWNTRKCRDIPADFEKVDLKPDELRAGAEYFRGNVQRRWNSRFASDGNDLDENGNITYGLTTEDNAYKNGLGFPSQEMVSYYVFVTVILYLYFFRGLRLKGKVIWITVLGVYLFIIIAIFRAIAVPGVSNGLKYILDFDNGQNLTQKYQMFHPQTWKDAAQQSLFSVSAGAGVHITLASYNKFNTVDIFRDAIGVLLIDFVTAILGSVLMFCAIGNIASSDQAQLSEVFTAGVDLLFEVCADFWGRLPASYFFSFVFYTILIFIALESVVVGITVIQAAVFEAFGDWFDRNGKIRWIVANTFLGISFLIAALCTTRGGLHVFIIFQQFISYTRLQLSCLATVIGLAWFWGLHEICDAAEAMTGKRPGVYLQFCWKFVSPLFLLVIIFIELLTPRQDYYYEDRGKRYHFVGWIQTFANFVSYIQLLIIPWGILHYIRKLDKIPWKQRFLLGISPNYEHEEIYENGTGKRAKALHYLYCVEWPPFLKKLMNRTRKITPEQEDSGQRKQGGGTVVVQMTSENGTEVLADKNPTTTNNGQDNDTHTKASSNRGKMIKTKQS